MSATEYLLAGEEHDDGQGDLAWCLERRRGSFLIAALGYMLRKVLRRTTRRITFDAPSFHRALTAVPRESLVVLAPSHRSYFDFLLVSYLLFEHPEFRIGRPRIAAAEEFSRIPLVAPVLQQAGAFYVKRDVGRRAAELDEQLQEIVARRESLMFFIEGRRSRDRSVLEPKRGLLRGLQATGRHFALLPIAISYERLPEEEALERELSQGRRLPMSLGAIMRWLGAVVDERVRLGHIHMTCGELLALDPDVDVPALAQRIVDEQRRCTVITDFHLRCFLEAARPEGVELTWLRGAVERRGQRVLASDLEPPRALSPTLRRSLENQWLHSFVADAAQHFPELQSLREEVERHRWHVSDPGDREDPRVRRVVDALFTCSNRWDEPTNTFLRPNSP